MCRWLNVPVHFLPISNADQLQHSLKFFWADLCSLTSIAVHQICCYCGNLHKEALEGLRGLPAIR